MIKLIQQQRVKRVHCFGQYLHKLFITICCCCLSSNRFFASSWVW